MKFKKNLLMSERERKGKEEEKHQFFVPLVYASLVDSRRCPDEATGSATPAS